MPLDFTRPVLLQPFNALPLQQTPWAGRGIAALLQPTTQDTLPPRLGECWEFSCDPQCPSRVVTSKARLDTEIAAQPQAALSPAVFNRSGPHCQLLVKLINASRPLSVQLHPDYRAEQPRAGKWESWLVLAAEPDSKAYLGFNTLLDRAQLHDEIAAGRLAQWLAPVTLRAGSYLEIPPRTVHALGPGAVVLEVQHLQEGQGGTTLRIWDWEHKYNAAGELDPQHGKARPLALAQALPLIDPVQQQQLHARALPTARPYFRSHGIEIVQRSTNPYYQLFTLTATAPASFTLHITAGYGIMLCWRGTWQLAEEHISSYQPLFLPAALGKMVVMCKEGSEAVLVVPIGAVVTCQQK